MAFVAVLCFMMTMLPLKVLASNVEGDALSAFKNGLSDPDQVLQSWDTSLVTPCTWFHVTCYNEVTDQIVQRLDLGSSKLEGPLVSNLGNLKRLQYLKLYQNKIYGSIPKEFGNLTELKSLDLYGNSLTGTIPTELSQQKKLIFLRLNDNNLSGKVPDELNDLVNLKVVDLSGNPGLCGAYTDRAC